MCASMSTSQFSYIIPFQADTRRFYSPLMPMGKSSHVNVVVAVARQGMPEHTLLLPCLSSPKDLHPWKLTGRTYAVLESIPWPRVDLG
jgi:hypothetical protein